MLQTPSVMDSFRRYVQHYSISGIDDDMLIYPLSAMAWDNMADHVVDDYEAIGLPFKDQDYPNRMQPHKFGDDAFAVELLDWETLYEEEGFYAGGVKLIHWLRKRPELSYEEFNAAWREHGKKMVQTSPARSHPQAGHRQTRPHGPVRLQGDAFRVSATWGTTPG